MSAVPSYTNPCVVADFSQPSSVFVVGVSDTTPGRLEIHRVNIGNIDYPTATFLNSYTNTTLWDARAAKFCDVFDGDRASVSGPDVFFQQFGPVSSTAQVMPNGTVSAWWPNVSLKASPRLFSATGAVEGHKWYTCTTPVKSDATNSVWMSVEMASDPNKSGHYDTQISTFPTNYALVSVGTYVPSTFTPAAGHLTVFDDTGSKGFVYTASSTVSEVASTRLQTLANPVPVEMSGIVLTKEATPVTMGSTGYIMDKTSSGTTILYSIQPTSGSFKLNRVDVKGDVPPFLPGRAATTRGTQIILFGGLSERQTPTSDFSVYDTVTNAWSGRRLVKQPTPPPVPSPTGGNGSRNGTSGDSPSSDTGSGNSNIGAIAGGVAGGVIVLALLGFFLYRTHKNKKGKRTDKSQSQDYSQNQANMPSHVVPPTTEYTPPTMMTVPEYYTHQVPLSGAQPQFFHQQQPGMIQTSQPLLQGYSQTQPQNQPPYYMSPTFVQDLSYIASSGESKIDYGSPAPSSALQSHSPTTVMQGSPTHVPAAGASYR